jgi:parallel beta-helix repeat protein
MKKSKLKIGLVLGIIALLVGASVPLTIGDIINIKNNKVEENNPHFDDDPRGITLYVGGMGPGNYSKINYAIENASSGDNIFVYSGTYYENVEVDKTVNITGEDIDTTTIDGSGSGNVVHVSEDDSIITGFTIKNGQIGMRMDNCEYVNVYGCNFTDNNYGMEINYYCYNNNISNCNIKNSNSRGISIGSSNTEDNEFYNNKIEVTDETGFHFTGHGSFDNTIDLSNTVNDCPVLFVTYEVNKTFDGIGLIAEPFEDVAVTNYGLVIIYQCYNVTVSNCTARNHLNDGIYVSGDNTNLVVRDCVVEDNNIGIHIADCEGANINSCDLSGNHYGIEMNYYCYFNNISNCVIENSGSRGISIGSSNTENNGFYNNNLQVTNEIGFYFSGTTSFKNTIDKTNTVNNCTVLFVTYEVDKTIDGVDSIVAPFEDVQVTNFGLIIVYECYNVVVSNCTARNHLNTGIYVGGDNTNLTIRDCTVDDNNVGIQFSNCVNAQVDNCDLTGNNYGVDINYYCYNNNVSNCFINNSITRGFSIGSSNTENNEFYNNNLQVTNEIGFYFSSTASFKNTIDKTNTVNNCTVLFVTYEVDKTIDGIDSIVAPFEDVAVTNFGLIIIYECYDVTVSNCTARNHLNSGIFVGGDNTNLVIRDCIAEDNNVGIQISNCENAHVDNCNLSGNNYGIDINYYCYNNNVSNCYIENSIGRGLSIGSSNTEDNEFYNNKIEVTSETGIYFYGTASFKNTIDKTNTVNDCPVVFVTYEVDKTVDGIHSIVEPFENIEVTNYGLIIVYECYNVTVSNCTATNHMNDGIFIGGVNTDVYIQDCIVDDNNVGIRFSRSEEAVLDRCNLSGNNYGIDINYYCYDNIVSNCDIQDSDNRGISIGSSSTENNIVTGCRIFDNNRGIHVVGSTNLIYNNYFDNSDNAYDSGNNEWNISKTLGENIAGGPYLGGNYWNDYTGNDTNGDGLGDTNLPYNSSGNILNGGDWHPLISIGNSPPSADFTFSPTYPTTDEIVQFNDTSTDSDGTIVSWLWDFGDNYLSTEQNPRHQFLDSGTFNVTLEVTDDNFGTDSITKQIIVTKFDGLITNLYFSWNLVSIPYRQPIDKTDIIVNYNNTNLTWQQAVDGAIILGFVYSWNVTNQNYGFTDILYPGIGYWIYSYCDCKLIKPVN